MPPVRVNSKNRRGATAVEYGLIAMLVSVAIIAGVTVFSESLGNLFEEVSVTVDVATGS